MVEKNSSAVPNDAPEEIEDGKVTERVTEEPEPDRSPFAYVGIGASAGGLEALEEFFKHMPAKSGMTFAVVQHQDPDQPSLLPEILQRYTQMPVLAVEENGMPARPDTVYIKPPGTDLSILKGTFILLKPTTTFGAKISIDTFLRHLAEDQDGKAVGIILSGMGSDGTLGVRAMKERTGMVMAQEPESAKFSSMPQSAIATGLVDYIASPKELSRLLCEYVEVKMHLREQHVSLSPIFENSLSKIFVLIRSRTGQDFALYKRSTIIRRIERRMGLHQLTLINDYIRYLQENPSEIEILSKELLIGVTRFFRDPDAWDALAEKALPELISSLPPGSLLRIWVVGCSTGEEAYSMAIVLQENLENLGRTGDIQFQIFATDTEKEAIDIARRGRFPMNIEADVSKARLERFFIEENATYRIHPHLRESIVFAPQNIIRDPPYTHLDIISCRNLFIYLSPELQRKIIALFHYALNPGGILFLGCAESIGNYDLFSTLDGNWRIFQKKDVPSLAASYDLPSVFSTRSDAQGTRDAFSSAAKGQSLTAIIQNQLLEMYAPPAVIITEDGDIVYFHGRTGKYLEPLSGKANLNIFVMAREGLRYALISLLRTAVAEKRRVTAEDVALPAENGTLHVRLMVQPILKHSGRADIYLVIFEDVPLPKSPEIQLANPGADISFPDRRLEELERDLAKARAELRQAAEQRQSTHEEMTSMNEELQSTNEELQSTNEELTTSKEELQSLNEELLTVNAELQSKIEAFSQSHDDMRNLLHTTKIPMLFLDSSLRVRRFTDAMKPIISLISNDVGRSITDLKVNLLGESLVDDVREVLDTLQYKEKQVETIDGKWFQMRVMPYRTSENRIDGVAVTFNDISTIKELEMSLQDAKIYAQNIVETISEPLVVLNSGMQVVSANRTFYETFQVTPQETEGKIIYSLGNKQWDIAGLHQLLEDILPRNAVFGSYDVEHDFPKIGRRIMRLNARRIISSKEDLILLAMEDITNEKGPESCN
ncbi:MAG: chemotaxis protein CheB [Methanothrix sp.]|nr:chemotaxis protein CheB [Methanothrix sp.]